MNSPVIPRWTFADHLRKARQIAGMNQKDFAEQIGVKPSAYAQWEAGNNRPRDVVSIAKRVEMLTRIPASWILDVDTPVGAHHPHPSPLGGGGAGTGNETARLPRVDSNHQPSGHDMAVA